MKFHYGIFVFIIAALLITIGCASTTPLIKASTRGDSSAVKKLIDEGANINEPDSKGMTPLMYAVLSRNIETVKVLLNKGADINARDKEIGYTPLFWASSYGYFDIVKFLIDRGADINVKNKEGETMLDIALSSTQGDIVDDLIKTGNINLWMPEAGKARLVFIGKDLYDYIKVTVGNRSKQLNQYMSLVKGAGVAFIDIDSGKHAIDANIDKYVSAKPTSINAIAGQTYYFRVTQNMGTRIVGKVLFTPANLIDKATGNNPFTITPLKESEAKQEIKELLKSKELK